MIPLQLQSSLTLALSSAKPAGQERDRENREHLNDFTTALLKATGNVDAAVALPDSEPDYQNTQERKSEAKKSASRTNEEPANTSTAFVAPLYGAPSANKVRGPLGHNGSEPVDSRYLTEEPPQRDGAAPVAAPAAPTHSSVKREIATLSSMDFVRADIDKSRPAPSEEKTISQIAANAGVKISSLETHFPPVVTNTLIDHVLATEDTSVVEKAPFRPGSATATLVGSKAQIPDHITEPALSEPLLQDEIRTVASSPLTQTSASERFPPVGVGVVGAAPTDNSVRQEIAALSPMDFVRADTDTSSSDRSEEKKISQAAANAGVEISVSSFETHFPPAVANALIDHSLTTQDTNAVEQTPLRPSAAAPSAAGSKVKILKFIMDPASLGEIAVKIRVTSAHIKIEIQPTSAETAALIDRSKDELARVIGDAGYENHAVSIQLLPASSDAQAMTSGGDGQRSFDGRPNEYSDRQSRSNSHQTRGDDVNETRSSSAPSNARDAGRPSRSSDIYI